MLGKKTRTCKTLPDGTGCSVESSRCFLMTVPLWFSEAARWRWSPRECPQSPITCVRKLQTDCPPAATTGGSGSATSTKKKKKSPTYTTKTHPAAVHRGETFQSHRYQFVSVLSRSLTERRASPAFRPATPLPRKEPRAITRRTRAPRPFLCPGPRFHQVSAVAFNFLNLFSFFQHLPGRERKQHKKTTVLLG